MANIKNHIYIKILDNEIWLYNKNNLYKEKTNNIMKNNFIINYKVLEDSLKRILTKYKLINLIIQNKIYILIDEFNLGDFLDIVSKVICKDEKLEKELEQNKTKILDKIQKITNEISNACLVNDNFDKFLPEI